MGTEDADDLIWEQWWLGRPADTHYSDGSSSALLFGDDGKGLRTHAVRGERVEEEDDEADESPNLLKPALALAAVFAMGVITAKAAPKVKAWWKRRRSTPISGVEDEAQEIAVTATAVEDFSSAVDVALGGQRTVSSAEAERRMLDILLAAAVIATNMRALSGARIEHSAASELQAAMEKLTVPQVTDSINHMLETDSSMLDDATATMLMQTFDGGRNADGEYVPLRTANIEEALRLPPIAV